MGEGATETKPGTQAGVKTADFQMAAISQVEKALENLFSAGGVKIYSISTFN